MWGRQSTFSNFEIKLVAASPSSGCDPYNYGIPTTPTAYLVDGLNKCALSNIIHNAQAKAAQALFIMNYDKTGIENIKIPDHISGRKEG